MMDAVSNLTSLLKRLPGMGEKSAQRLAYFLIKSDESYNKALSEAIGTLKDKIHPCPVCGAYIEEECPFCSDKGRDKSIICIVEEPQDVLTIASSGAYSGLFHVLGGAINPLKGITPDKLRIRELVSRIENGSFSEVIIATNPTEEGDTTALFIKEALKKFEDLKITRPSSGLPIGGDLGYVDKTTLSRSLKGRVSL